MRRFIRDKRGVALMTAMMVMVVVLMFSSILLSVAMISATTGKNKTEEISDSIYAQAIGEAFIAEGLSLDVTAYSADYVVEINNAEQKLSVRRAKDDALLLQVQIREEPTQNKLVSWHRYYNLN